ncbi:MAG TPA: tyrosine-type recombinase/integrase [Ilumatobacteraceae bacterium]|nr:tyrosine-type recombinase/integrase [Ilumatobacteraceae bacterium]HRB04095.1 tyrosine-type recombinase/integrase [Ilumatobacteraceae bacterium]
MSSVTKVGKDKWQARYRTPAGASRKRMFEKKVDAEQFLTSVDHRKLTGEYVDQAAGRTTFGVYARQWADAQPHRPSTSASLESMLRRHIIPKLGARPIGRIQPTEIQAFVTGLNLAPSTVATLYGKVSAIFAAAVLDRVITSSPCSKAIKLPRPAGGVITPMTAAEVRSMVGAVDARYSALLVMMAGTGLRPGEALGVTADRVDFLRRTIRVDRQLLTVTGAMPAFAPPKTPGSNRTVVVPSNALDALSAHMATYAQGQDGLLFTREDGSPIRRDLLGSVWRAAAEKATVIDRSPHDLRHYAASVMIQQGASVKAVQEQLGHEKASTTLDTYTHLWPSSNDITRRALEAGLDAVVSDSCPAVATDA